MSGRAVRYTLDEGWPSKLTAYKCTTSFLVELRALRLTEARIGLSQSLIDIAQPVFKSGSIAMTQDNRQHGCERRHTGVLFQVQPIEDTQNPDGGALSIFLLS